MTKQGLQLELQLGYFAGGTRGQRAAQVKPLEDSGILNLIAPMSTRLLGAEKRARDSGICHSQRNCVSALHFSGYLDSFRRVVAKEYNWPDFQPTDVQFSAFTWSTRLGESLLPPATAAWSLSWWATYGRSWSSYSVGTSSIGTSRVRTSPRSAFGAFCTPSTIPASNVCPSSSSSLGLSKSAPSTTEIPR